MRARHNVKLMAFVMWIMFLPLHLLTKRSVLKATMPIDLHSHPCWSQSLPPVWRGTYIVGRHKVARPISSGICSPGLLCGKPMMLVHASCGEHCSRFGVHPAAPGHRATYCLAPHALMRSGRDRISDSRRKYRYAGRAPYISGPVAAKARLFQRYS